MFALIVDNIVHEVFEVRPDFHSSLEIIEVPANVEVSWIRNAEGQFDAPPPPAPVHSDPDKTEEEKAAINAALQYKRDRLEKYPAIGDQVDALWHMIDNGETFDKTSSFYTMIKTVKDTYPKSS